MAAGIGIGEAEAGVTLLRFLWRPMRPVLNFGAPSQGATEETPHRSWWHIPVSIKDAGMLRKRFLPGAEVVAVRYLKNTQVGEGINLRWKTRDGPTYKIDLEFGVDYQVPFARRDENEGFIVICNDDVYQNKFKWRLTREGFFRWDERIHGPDEIQFIEWKIEVRRPAQKPWVGLQPYIISVPKDDVPNETFRISMR